MYAFKGKMNTKLTKQINENAKERTTLKKKNI